MNIILSGKIETIFPVETPGTGTFQKRVLWLNETTDSPYPSTWQIEFQQSGVPMLDNFRSGQFVEVKCNIQGRKFNKKANGEEFVINTIRGWSIQLQGSVNVVQQYPPKPQEPAPQQYNKPDVWKGNNSHNNGLFQQQDAPDDLPF